MATLSMCIEEIGVTLNSSWCLSEKKKKKVRQKRESERMRAQPGRATG
jgi:hypothetical protein